MPTPIETVQSYVAELAKDRTAMYQSFHTYFTPTTVWENSSMATTVGPDEAIAFMEQFEAQTGMNTIQIDMLAIAQAGNHVLTERVDRIINAQGDEVMAIRIMGIFEVENGRFVTWREYFDTAPFVGAA